jgi:hypothetical protein
MTENRQSNSILKSKIQSVWIRALALLLLALVGGCGTTTKQNGTEQLLLSDAIDEAIAQIDFRHLTGRKVYLDTIHLQHVKAAGFVNAEYVTSSIRQQLTASRCSILDNKEEADVIVEPRVGALGTDGQDITFGLPQSNALSAAASAVGSSIPVPIIPEISVGRSNAQSGIAKIVVFAYDRETRQPVWQSGIARAEATSRNTWFLGAGPIQRGTIYDGVRFAGSDFGLGSGAESQHAYPAVDYRAAHVFPLYGPLTSRTAENVETSGDSTEKK